VNTPAKLGLFGAVLGAVFVASLGVGTAIGPVAGAGDTTTQHDMSSGEGDAVQGVNMGPRGLAVSTSGYTLAPATTVLPVGAPTDFTFRIFGPDGSPVTKYTPQHERDLHFIVVRRDLVGYQHLHPTLAPDGTWSVPLRLPAAGVYKAFTDFDPAGAPMPMTLAVDLFASGDFQAAPFPAPSPTATVDDYTVTVTGTLTAGKESDLTFTFGKDGKPVTDLQPYLGAYGHLVALRGGDLAYLHVHPDGAPGDGQTVAGPTVVFHTEVLTSGAHRLFLDFQHGGVVRTAEFTVVATGASS
jgi:hypothetical protein